MFGFFRRHKAEPWILTRPELVEAIARIKRARAEHPIECAEDLLGYYRVHDRLVRALADLDRFGLERIEVPTGH